ncbi:MAG: fasciclin domain-containing protein, partial [Planctomycetota bacterium]
GPLTVFAPTDRAFLKLGNETLRTLINDPQTLSDILLTHVVAGEIFAADVLAGGTAAPLSGQELLFNATPFGAYINTSRVTTPNVQLQNGVLHAIDAVIVPPQPTVVDALVAFPEFNTLVDAVGVADLAGALSGDGPFTVFAPLDSAFAALPTPALNALLADPKALAGVLTYHVVPGEFFAADVVALPGATTLQGQDVTFSVQDGEVFVNSSKVVATDIRVGNGVLHFIDTVLEIPGS